MHICVFLLVFAQVSTSSILLHNRTRRASPGQCPSCKRSSLCAPKYEVYPGHTACIPKSASAKPIEWTEAEKMEIVAHHNKLRAAVTPPAGDMLKMSWDSELEMLAKRWAEACEKSERDSFFHDSLRLIPGRFPVGQNIAWGYATIKAATDAWYGENVDYAKYFGQNLTTFPPGPQIGHYTQLVWASTSLIGCAASKCGPTFYVCDYGPGGNGFPFSSPYTQARTAGDMCPDHKTSDGLCDCGALACENRAGTNATTCTCNCKYPVHVLPYCTLDCSQNDGKFCGTQAAFMPELCLKSYVNAACPHLCGICPCAEKSYNTTLAQCSARSDLIASRVDRIFAWMSAVFVLALTL